MRNQATPPPAPRGDPPTDAHPTPDTEADQAGADPAVSVQGLSKTYGGAAPAVDDVSFTVAPGEIFGILGSNGAGKTTVVECLQGLRGADAGELTVLGLDPARETRQLRRRIGAQLQESALPDRMRVWEALDLFASLSPAGADWRHLLDTWGLSHRAKASFASLSGGERQRLFVALALVGRPELVFLDELTQGLDPAARRLAWRLIRQIREQGTTVVLVTHYMDEAEALCDRVIVLDRGRILAEGTPQQLIAESTQGLTVRFSSDGQDLNWLEGVDNVESVMRYGDQVEVHGRGAVVATVAAALVAHGIVPADLRPIQPTLEQVFLELTGRSDEVTP